MSTHSTRARYRRFHRLARRYWQGARGSGLEWVCKRAVYGVAARKHGIDGSNFDRLFDRCFDDRHSPNLGLYQFHDHLTGCLLAQRQMSLPL